MPYMWGRALVALESEEVNNGNSYDGRYGGQNILRRIGTALALGCWTRVWIILILYHAYAYLTSLSASSTPELITLAPVAQGIPDNASKPNRVPAKIHLQSPNTHHAFISDEPSHSIHALKPACSLPSLSPRVRQPQPHPHPQSPMPITPHHPLPNPPPPAHILPSHLISSQVKCNATNAAPDPPHP